MGRQMSKFFFFSSEDYCLCLQVRSFFMSCAPLHILSLLSNKSDPPSQLLVAPCWTADSADGPPFYRHNPPNPDIMPPISTAYISSFVSSCIRICLIADLAAFLTRQFLGVPLIL